MAGANDLQLELGDGTNTYTFSYDGRLRISQEYQYNENPEPPELKQIIERWEIQDAHIVAAEDEALWDALQAFLTHVEDSATTPLTYARLVRDPTNAAVVERTLGTSNKEGFRLESVMLGDESITELENGEWRVHVPVTLSLAAIQTFPDGNGISSFEQTIRNTYDRRGLHTLEWETAISVQEGAATSALTQAQTYAVIPIADYGNTYVWDTNGPDGLDIEESDPDTRPATDRTPTKLRCVSRIKQVGITVGTPTAGNSVGFVDLRVTTEKDGAIVRTITEADAEGPGALAWVNNQKPSGNIKQSRVTDGQAGRSASGMWIVETTDAGDSSDRREVMLMLRGGGEDFEYVPVPGFDPQLVIGARQPYRADVTVRVTYEGEQPTVDDMPFPEKLPFPWKFNANLSREDAAPRLQKAGEEKGAESWVREAHGVFFAPSDINLDDFLSVVVSTNNVRSWLAE